MGKSRTGAETLLEWIIAEPEWDGIPTEWAIFAETKGDAGNICVLGPSGFVRAMTADSAVVNLRAFTDSGDLPAWMVGVTVWQTEDEARKNAESGGSHAFWPALA